MNAEPVRHLPVARGWRIWRTVALRGAGLPVELLDTLADPPSAAAPEDLRDRSARAIDRLLLDDTFRSALAWQNPELLHNWVADYVDALRRGERPRLSRRDRREALIARYVQRYCAKNETVGFFGAVGWARFAESGPDLAVTGSGGVRRHTVHLETWAAEAVAAAWRRDARVLPLLPVRLDPASTFTGGMLRRAWRGPRPVDVLTGAILAAADGCRTVGEVVEDAARAAPGHTEDHVRYRLLELHDKGVLQVGFQVPIDAWPEEHLRRQVGKLPDPAVRTELEADLAELDAAKGAARLADPDRLPSVLETAARTVTRISGTECSRQDRFGRTPLYLDCRRDLDVTVGPGALARLSLPLAVLLDSARWLAAEVGDAVGRELQATYADLRRRTADVALGELQFAAAHVLSGADGWAEEIRTDFQLRWAEILRCADHADGEVVVSGAEAAELADVLFPPCAPRWAAARHHSPDLMVARGADGRVRWVLGELHIALNTLESRVFRTQADDPDALIRGTAADMRNGRIVPLYPSTGTQVTSRTYPPTSLDPPGHYRYWSYGPDQGHSDGTPSVPAAALRVAEHDGELVAQHHDGGWEAPALEFFGEFLTALVVNLFKLRPVRDHAPRTAIDDVVVCRESWRFAAETVPVPRTRSVDYGHERLRRWADGRLPRRVFVRTVTEPKPFYVDFAATLTVENLARAIRRAPGSTDVEITEMLPGPEQLWLTDEIGRRHTAEFRMVAVDPHQTAPVVRPIGAAGAKEEP